MKRFNSRSFLNLSFLCVASLVLAFAFVLGSLKFNYRLDYSSYVKEYSTYYDLDKNLVYAIIYAESSFKPNAVSSANAIGLMQILPLTATWIADELNITNFQTSDLTIPEVNINMGCFYLHYLFSKFKNEKVVLFCYNAGEGVYYQNISEYSNFETMLENFSSVENYIRKVQKIKKLYQFLY